MKKLSVLAIALLCTCVALFHWRDTIRGRGWPRGVEPRLSTVEQWSPCSKRPPAIGRVVEEVRCEDEQLSSKGTCEIYNVDQARRAMSEQPQCMDKVIATLNAAISKTAPPDAKVLNDLAAALILRAQRQNRPEDLLSALRQADAALAKAPDLPAARFNRALILEHLGLEDAAITAWNHSIAIGKGGWLQEAQERRDALKRRVAHDERWRRLQPHLAAALRAGDAARVHALIAPYPFAAVRYFEEVLLLQWANEPTPQHLTQLKLLATELSTRLAVNGEADHFALHTVAELERAGDVPEKLEALREGHRAFVDARRRELEFLPGYPELYQVAAQHLADTPFALRAEIPVAPIESLPSLIARIPRQYRHLRAFALWTLAQKQSEISDVEAIATYSEALKLYTSLRDEEGLTAIHSRLAGVYRDLGDKRRGWTEAYYSERHSDRLIVARHRTAHALEAARAARDLGYYNGARLYLDEMIGDFDKEHDGVDDAELPSGQATQLASALRHRAALRVLLGDGRGARADLQRLLKVKEATETIDKDILRWLDARDAEVQAQSLAQTDSATAVAALTQALEQTGAPLRAVRASLLIQRARVSNDPDARERDLVEAIGILQTAGLEMLRQTDRETPETLWRHYFGRFQDAYSDLIALYMERGEAAKAFEYAEQARGAEPLYRVGGSALTIPELRQGLPANTYIVEYRVLESRTYVWVLGRNIFEHFEITGRQGIDALIRRFDEAFRQSEDGELNAVMTDAYRELFARAWGAISTHHREGTPRIVIVPDGRLHGLPFVALRDAAGQYLVQKAIVETGGSAALYVNSVARDREMACRPNPRVLLVANPAYDEKLPFVEPLGLDPLQAAEPEIRDIAPQYVGSEQWTRNDATVDVFLRRLPLYDVAHVAAHGIVYSDQAVLLFTPTPTDRGLLEAKDLMPLNLPHTRLIVLSACTSAGGLSIGAEGVAPLVRPILAAKVPGVVGTLWNIPDDTTKEVMVSFHTQYVKGSDAAAALRDAQTEAIVTDQPFKAWAAFQVIGHARSPFACNRGDNSSGIPSSYSLQRSDRLCSQ